MKDVVIVSLNVSTPRTMRAMDTESGEWRDWSSVIYKNPVEGPVWLGWENLVGDSQADRRVHGGPDQAALCYSAEHYAHWRDELGRSDLAYAAFGENFTISGLSETTVCQGDIYEVGDARIQVTKLRGPCWKLALRTGCPDMVERVLANARSGWYVRAQREGFVEVGHAVRLVERDPGAPSLLELHNRKYGRNILDQGMATVRAE